MIVIDPADFPEKIYEKVIQMGGKPAAILLTHGHFDHIMAAQAVKEKYNIPIYACRQEEEMLREPSVNMTAHYGKNCSIIPDVLLNDLEVFQVAGFTIQIIHTPGHTPGGCSYYVADAGCVFSGDTLFAESVGRSDFPGGSTSALVRAVKEKLFLLPDDTLVCPGHGEETTIGHEKKYNSFV